LILALKDLVLLLTYINISLNPRFKKEIIEFIEEKLPNVTGNLN